MTLFSINNLRWSHSNSRPLFNQISIDIPAGTIVSIHGESGCGKTTLVQILGMLWDRKIPNGMVSLDLDGSQRDYSSLSSTERDRYRREKFGFVLQNSYLVPHLSCLWNMSLPQYLSGVGFSAGAKKAQDILSGGGYLPTADPKLLNHLTKQSSKISQGQRQRFNILRALANDPSVVFADEPTSNLDENTSLFFYDVLKRWQIQRDGERAHKSLIVISHILEHAYEERFLNAQLFIIIRQNREYFHTDSDANHSLSNARSHDIQVISRSEVPTLADLKALIHTRASGPR